MRKALHIFIGLLAPLASAHAGVSDIWTYWRFQMNRGYYASLLEGLDNFDPVSVFDTQKKTLLKAHVYQLLGKTELSRQWFERATRDYPLLADYAQYRIVQLSWNEKGREKEFIEQARSFLGRYPQSAFSVNVRRQLIQFYFDQGQCDSVVSEAEELGRYQWLLSQTEQMHLTWLQANCEIKIGRQAVALRRLIQLWSRTVEEDQAQKIEKLVKSGGGVLSSSSVMERAKLLRSFAHHAEAIQLLQSELPKEKCATECRRLLAGLFFANKQYEEAVSVYQQLYQEARSPGFLYLVCRSQARAGDPEKALKCYEDLEQARGKSKNLRLMEVYYRAQLLLDMEQMDEAQKYFQKVVSLTSGNEYAHRALWTLGWIQFQMKKPQASLPYFEKLRTRGPTGLESGQGAYWSARAMDEIGRGDEAKNLYKLVATKFPLSYYGVLSRNRLEEQKAPQLKELNSQPLLRYERLPETERLDDLYELFETPQQRVYLLQLGEMSDLGLMDEARMLLKWVFCSEQCSRGKLNRALGVQQLQNLARSYKIHPRALIRLFIEVQDYYNAIQVAHMQIGYDQSAYPRSDNEWFYWNVLYPRPYQAWVEPLAGQYHFPSIVLWSLMRSESLFREKIISNAGARGLLQIMPNTGAKLAEKLKLEDFSVEQLMIPHVNILLSARYIHDLLYKMDGNLVFTIAAYNAGPHKVRRWMDTLKANQMDEFIERIPYAETRQYVMKNIHFLAAYSFAYQPKAPHFRVSNAMHTAPHPLLDPEKEVWDYDLLY